VASINAAAFATLTAQNDFSAFDWRAEPILTFVVNEENEIKTTPVNAAKSLWAGCRRAA